MVRFINITHTHSLLSFNHYFLLSLCTTEDIHDTLVVIVLPENLEHFIFDIGFIESDIEPIVPLFFILLQLIPFVLHILFLEI